MLNRVLPVLIFMSAFGYITSLLKDWNDFRLLLVHVPLHALGYDDMIYMVFSWFGTL